MRNLRLQFVLNFFLATCANSDRERLENLYVLLTNLPNYGYPHFALHFVAMTLDSLPPLLLLLALGSTMNSGSEGFPPQQLLKH